MKKKVRKLLWKLIYKRLYTKVASRSPLGYPVMVFIELEGEENFVELGNDKFNDLVVEKVDSVFTILTNSILEQKKEQERIDNLSPEEFEKEKMEAYIKFSEAIDKQQKEEMDEQFAICDKLIEQL